MNLSVLSCQIVFWDYRHPRHFRVTFVPTNPIPLFAYITKIHLILSNMAVFWARSEWEPAEELGTLWPERVVQHGNCCLVLFFPFWNDNYSLKWISDILFISTATKQRNRPPYLHTFQGCNENLVTILQCSSFSHRSSHPQVNHIVLRLILLHHKLLGGI